MNVSCQPKILNKVVKKLLSEKDDRTNRHSSKIVSENVETNFVALNDSVYLNKTGETLEHGDLRVDNINSFYLGRHIIRNGDRPQKFIRAYDPMSQFYNFNKPLFDNNKVFVDRNVVMSGCFKSNKVTLQRTMIPDINNDVSGLPSFKSIKVFDKAISIAIRKLKIVQQAKVLKEDILLTSFKSSTYPGFRYKEYYNQKTKDEACLTALELANARWDEISNSFKERRHLKRNNIFPNTFVVGARNKREYDFIDDDLLSSRAVHMPEFHTELNSSLWIEQISNHIKQAGVGPIYLGNSIVKYERLVKDFGDSTRIIEGDWKRFDSRLYITNIIIGLSILRCFYDVKDDEIDQHFIALFDTIGIKDYYTPGGYMFRMIHGLPSGVCSTSLLGSVINLVNLIHCTKNFPSKKVKFIVGGDDFLIVLDNDVCKNIDDSDIIESVNKFSTEIGQVFKFLEMKNPLSNKILERPSFYKYTIDSGEPVVFPTAILERTFLPWNKRYNNYFKIYNFLRDLLPSLGSPRSFHLPFYYFYIDIYFKVFNRKISLKEILFEHSQIHSRVMSGDLFIIKDKQILYKVFPFMPSQTDSPSQNKVVFRNSLFEYKKVFLKI